MFEQVEELVREHSDLETRLADPSLHADPGAARTLGKRYAELGPVVAAYSCKPHAVRIDSWNDDRYPTDRLSQSCATTIRTSSSLPTAGTCN